MGDSLTDKRHWANREVAWVDLLKDRLKENYRVGRHDRQPRDRRDAAPPEPHPDADLAREGPRARPRDDLLRRQRLGRRDAPRGVRRDRRGRRRPRPPARRSGKADVLILTSNPSAQRWEGLAELAEACRTAARDRNAGLADTERAFHDAGRDDHDRLFVHDRVHLSRAGHEVVAETVLKAIDGGRTP